MARRGGDQPRERLSRERILAAAGEIAQSEGLDALSMRRLAQELDVWPMSVYRYFQDKDALLDSLAATAAGEIGDAPTSGSWRAQIAELLDGARRSVAASSGIGGRLARAFLSPEALRLSEAAMSILLEAGLSPEQAARGWRALWSYTFGFATFQLADSADEAERRVRASVAALPAHDYPALASAGDELAAAFAEDAAFAAGLELILDGLEAEVTVTR